MELELSLSPPNQKTQPIKKSCHGNDHRSASTLLRFPLVSWHQDEDHQHANIFFHQDYQWKRFVEEKRHEFEGVGFNGRVDEEGDQNFNVMSNNQEVFVKVKMDGVGIARKINLNCLHSYQMLYTTLIQMFDKYVESEEDGASYKLMYQHQDGYWLLAGDIPWDVFIHTVKRIQMVRNSTVADS